MTACHPHPSDPRFQDLTGKVFGRLTVLGYAGTKTRASGSKRRHCWTCECECGETLPVNGQSLKSGNTKSCGCLKTESITTHGKCKTSVYQIWANMLTRCNNAKHRDYHRYGGRGIQVCDRWHDFENFLADMGERSSETLSIDRIENDGDYEPSNCRWATKLEQDNNRRTNRMLTHDGRTMSVADWARESGIEYSTLTGRLHRGWTVGKSLTAEIQDMGRNVITLPSN